MDSIFKMIAVRPPYVDLKNMSMSPGIFVARTSPSHPMGAERGAIAAAEAGRHLAIAGAAAAASTHTVRGKHFYLARTASLRNLAPGHAMAPTGQPLQIRASSDGVTRRRATSTASMFERDGAAETALFALSVTYDVLPQPLFQRLVGAADDTAPQPAPAEVMEMSLPAQPGPDGAWHAALRVEAAHCAGHFPEFPALPVAKLMHLLSNLAGAHLADLLGVPDIPFSVLSAEVEAQRLAPAGTEVQMVSQALGPGSEDGTHSFRCEARIPDGLCGSMTLVLAADT